MSAQVIHSRPEFADILRDQETYQSGTAGVGNDINGWFDRLMIQSGWRAAPSAVLALCVLLGLAVGGGVFVLQENLLTAALAFAIGVTIPILIAVAMRARRQRELNRQLPGMIDELSRAARAGRSLEECLKMVANDTAAPLGTELKLCTRRIELGLSVDSALADLPARTGLVSVSVLVTALAVHRQTGGDLIQVLERLSRTVRDRQEFQGRLKAQTAASRATAMLMVVLPPVILAFFMFRDPTYLPNLLESPWGSRSLVLAIALLFVGILWVMRVLRSSTKS
jgi:tight adherence protein B